MVQAQEGTRLSRADFISDISTAEVPMEQREGDPCRDQSPPAPAGPYEDGAWPRPVPPAPPETWRWRAWGWPCFLLLFSSTLYCHFLAGLDLPPQPLGREPQLLGRGSSGGGLKSKNNL